MKQLKLSKYMRWSPDQVHALILDVEAYPGVYPMVRRVEIKAQKPGFRDVEMAFNLAAHALINDPVLGVRITSSPPRRISVEQTRGQLKALKLEWILNHGADGGTDLDFRMEYEIGMGKIADTLAFPVARRIVGDTLTRFEAQAARIYPLLS